MEKKPESRNGMAMLVIGGLLVAIVIVLWYYVGSRPANTPPANSRTDASVSPTPAGIPANVPPGADPPNQAGSPTAAVTIEEFADFQCGSCAAVHPVWNEIKSIYGSRIHFIFRNFPLNIPAHDKSYEAAVAAEAAAMQGGQNKFWEMQNLLFSNQQTWTDDPNYKNVWADYAKKIGLNVEKFKDDMLGIAAKSRVDADIARGRAIPINATPTVYINGISVPFSQMKVEPLKQIIDAELQKAQGGDKKPAANSGEPAASNTGQ